MIRSTLLVAAVFLSSQALGQVKVENAWVRSPATGQTVTGAFMKLTSTEPVLLVGVDSSVAKSAEIHETTVVDGVMRMRMKRVVDLTPAQPLEFKPGGYHIMLMGLTKTISAGDHVRLVLKIRSKSGKTARITVDAVARALDGAPSHEPTKH